jgi:hypothetical protein
MGKVLADLATIIVETRVMSAANPIKSSINFECLMIVRMPLGGLERSSQVVLFSES